MGKKHKSNAHEGSRRAERMSGRERHSDAETGHRSDSRNENPPRTTSHDWLTTPKFGSSTSGGGEIEPGPERD